MVSFFTTGPGATTLPILIYRLSGAALRLTSTPCPPCSSSRPSSGRSASRCCSDDGNHLEARHVQTTHGPGCPVGFATAALGQKNQLNLFIWSEYIDPQIITDFETEYDCKVTIDLYEDNESMLAKLQSGGAALYDICVPSDYIIRRC